MNSTPINPIKPIENMDNNTPNNMHERKLKPKPRTIVINFRLTENQHNYILAKMVEAGYGNLSLYIRDRVLNGRVQNKRMPEHAVGIQKQIHEISSKIGRVGNNYNQVVRSINSIVAKMSDNEEMLGYRAIVYQMTKLEKCTHALFVHLDEIKGLINTLEDTDDEDNAKQ